MTDRIVRKLSLERLPRRYRALATQSIEAEDARERAELDARRLAIERAVEEHGRALAELASPRALRALADAARRERAALRALRESPGVAASEVEKAVRTGRKRLERAARELRIDVAALRRIGALRSRRLQRAAAAWGAGVKAGRLLSPKAGKFGVRPPVDPPDQVVTPPFLIGVEYRGSYASEGFTVGLDWEIDEPTGRVTTRTWMRCPDASWWNDFGSVWVEANVVFVYTAPETGRLSVLVDATSLESFNRIRLEDEFGISGNETHLHNFLTMRVYHPATPGLSAVEMRHFSRTGTDGDFYETARYPGSRTYAALESNGTVQAGDTFFVAIGTRNFQWSSTDDVEVESRADWSWVINALDLSTLPGGPIFTVGRRAATAAARSRKRRARKR